jgi:hypothetical protein
MNLEQGLFVGMVTGVVGMAYFVYGKKQGLPIPLLSGIGLMVYPYFIDSLTISIAIGVVLASLPFFIKTE